MKSTITILIIVFFASFLVKNTFTVKSQSSHGSKTSHEDNKTTKAICLIAPLGNSSVKGVVTFEKVDSGIKIDAQIEGLMPGKHGFHIHECGDCSAKDGSSAGGHFNPENMPHGAPASTNKHAGDMGNIEADNNGKAHLKYVDKHMTFDGSASIIGHAVIVHKDADDLKSQPTGNAGGREACGVIGIVCK